MADLSPQKWKDVNVSRGVKYHYYYALATQNKVTLLFVHGFPSLGRDWRKISIPLERLGYGIIIPDMFGYGGTSKPTDPAQYKLKLLSQDLVDLLDAENVGKAVAIGHDWGSYVVSRLANYFPDRFHAFAHFSVPFMIPDTTVTFEKTIAFLQALLGYDPYGYWWFFNEEDADKVIAEHLDSYMSIVYVKDQSTWRELVCAQGALRPALLADYKSASGFASYMSDADIKIVTETFRRDGLGGALCYYKATIAELNRLDEDAILPEQQLPPVSTPIYFGVGQHDVICTPKIGKMMFSLDPFKNHIITIKEYDGDHWLVISNGEEIARELDTWVSDVVVPTIKA